LGQLGGGGVRGGGTGIFSKPFSYRDGVQMFRFALIWAALEGADSLIADKQLLNSVRTVASLCMHGPTGLTEKARFCSEVESAQNY